MSINERLGAHYEPWMDDPTRPCVTNDPELFFDPAADRYSRAVKKSDDWAKELCAGCPALDMCRQRALDGREEFGVWGGTTANERFEILARRDAA